MCGRATHHRPTQPRGHPSPRPRRHWRLSGLHGILSVVAIPRPMGSLEAFRRGRPWRAWQAAPNSRETPASEPTTGRNQRESEFYCNHRSRVAPCADRNGNRVASMRLHRCHPRYCHACTTGPANHSSQRRPYVEFPRQPRSVVASRRHTRRDSVSSPLP